MKLIRSGGTNAKLQKEDEDYYKFGFGNYFMHQIKPELDALIDEGGPIALCVAAKPNKHHYDPRLSDMGFELQNFTILGREDNADWGHYSAVLLLGGETNALYDWLQKTDFSLNALQQCRILAGDSAGAYVLSGKTLIDYTPDGANFEVKDGFLPEVRQLIAAHSNNPRYHTPQLTMTLRQWCQAHAIEYIELQENEITSQDI